MTTPDTSAAVLPTWVTLVCPACKSPLHRRGNVGFACPACNSSFESHGGLVNFRRTYPDGAISPAGWAHWLAEQREYESWAESEMSRFDPRAARRVSATLEPIYAELTPLKGRVLDVAGGFGLVREFLHTSDEYLSIDPWLGAPQHLAQHLDALRAVYPRATIPVPFVAGNAEWLPFSASTFDWVHMRSCIDHFFDPFQALKEAWRVLRPSGHLAIGLAAAGGGSAVLSPGMLGFAARAARVFRNDGARAVLKRSLEKLRHPLERDHHIWHPTSENLIHLVQSAGFAVQEWRWQAPPDDHCLYLRAQKLPGATVL